MEFKPKRADFSAPLTPLTSVDASGDPSPLENPGLDYSEDGGYCETCKMSLTGQEWATRNHIGHSVVNSKPSHLPDQGDHMGEIGQQGGSYRIKWATDGIKPDEKA